MQRSHCTKDEGQTFRAFGDRAGKYDKLVFGLDRPKVLTTAAGPDGDRFSVFVDLLQVDPSGIDPWKLPPHRWDFRDTGVSPHHKQVLTLFRLVAQRMYDEMDSAHQIVSYLEAEGKKGFVATSAAFAHARAALVFLIEQKGYESLRSFLELADDTLCQFSTLTACELTRRILNGSLDQSTEVQCIRDIESGLQSGRVRASAIDATIEAWQRAGGHLARIPRSLLSS